MKIEIAICDDEKIALSAISGAVKNAFLDFGIETIIYEYDSIKKLNFVLDDKRFDLFLLDIDMNEQEDGIEFAKKMKKNNPDILIVFVSNREDRVFDAFDVQPLGFIRKNSFINDLGKYIQIMINKINAMKKNNLLLFNKNQTIESVDLSKIMYVECSYKEQYFYTENKNIFYTTKKTMKELENLLDEAGFIRIHNSYLVNYNFIFNILTNQVLLKNGEKLPLSRRNKDSSKSKYLALMKKNGIII